MVTRQSIDVSPLEAELARRGFSWTRVDALVAASDHTLLGVSRRLGHDRAPAIYMFLRPALDRWVASVSDDELRQFVDVMQHGSQAEQEAAVEAAMDEVLGSPP